MIGIQGSLNSLVIAARQAVWGTELFLCRTTKRCDRARGITRGGEQEGGPERSRACAIGGAAVGVPDTAYDLKRSIDMADLDLTVQVTALAAGPYRSPRATGVCQLHKVPHPARHQEGRLVDVLPLLLDASDRPARRQCSLNAAATGSKAEPRADHATAVR